MTSAFIVKWQQNRPLCRQKYSSKQCATEKWHPWDVKIKSNGRQSENFHLW